MKTGMKQARLRLELLTQIQIGMRASSILQPVTISILQTRIKHKATIRIMRNPTMIIRLRGKITPRVSQS